MASRFFFLSVLCLLAACHGEQKAAPPAPASAPAVTDSPPLASADSALTGSFAAVPAIPRAELDRRTAELFGDALRVDATIPVPADTMALEVDPEPSWDIEVRSYETLDRVRFFVGMFTGPARDRFTDRLRRGTRYENMIREKLRAGDLPEDMYYLAMVESGFNPHAYSSAAAVGMWQFMTSTARGMGMRVDWWVDERRDPVRSTRAAVAFLRGLREQFGSMYLAAAAYNGGPGRIARGLSRYEDDLEGTTGDDLFFALAEKKYLRNETRDYVPQLVASALVAKEPKRYMLAFDSVPSFTYDSVRVGPRVPLAAIAAAAGTTVREIQDLNPHILRGMTPPKDSIQVRIPVGAAAQFRETFDTLSDGAKAGAQIITVGSGATWASLARKAPMTVTARVISNYNPTVKANKKTGVITKGTVVLVPTAATLAASLNVPDPSIERYGSSGSTYVVKRGDNLSVIAKRYRTTPAAIMRLNRLKKPLIFPGQELIVSGSASQAKPAPKASAKSSSTKATATPKKGTTSQR